MNLLQERTLFEECIDVLGKNNVTILSKNEFNDIWKLFKDIIPITKGSRIDWGKVPGEIEVHSPTEVLPTLKNLIKQPIDTSVYILWNDFHTPVIKTNLEIALEHFDYVTCIDFETWFFNPSQGYIIEFYYLGEMHVGLLPEKVKL